MRYYETLYILNPNFEQERVNSITKEIEDQVGKISSIINHKPWGKKRLAYPVEQHKYGNFMLLQYESDEPRRLDDFTNFMKLNNSIFRFQTIRLNEKPEKSESDDTVPKTNMSVMNKNEQRKEDITPDVSVDVKGENAEEAQKVATDEPAPEETAD